MHSIDVAGSRSALRGSVDLGRNGGRPQLRFQPFANGDLAVFAPEGGRIDGNAIVGGLAIVSWGAGAIVRTIDLRVEVRWERLREIRGATGGSRCAMCFGALDAGETVVVCPCETAVHEACYGVQISCSRCGEVA